MFVRKTIMRTGAILGALVAAGAVVFVARRAPATENGDGVSHADHRRKPLPTTKEIAMLPPDGGPEFNRLVFEKSPYLLQHARNPVDWYPWGEEAFAKARQEGKPIFLSVGYSTDERWFLPHFEKMLYDNAQLANAYVEAFRITGDQRHRRVAEGICEWVLRDMTGDEGGFYSALDADSEGEEGKFYVWTRDEVHRVLGRETGQLFCEVYGIEEGGNFRDEATRQKSGTNIPYQAKTIEQHAKARGIPAGELRSRLAEARRKLLEVRNDRIWPHLDDKVLTAWNGLMIGALAYGGKHLGEPRYTAAAEKAASFVLATMRKDGRLLRTYRDGEAGRREVPEGGEGDVRVQPGPDVRLRGRGLAHG